MRRGMSWRVGDEGSDTVNQKAVLPVQKSGCSPEA